MIITRQEDVTDVVLAAMSGAPNERLRTVMAAFVRHLHEFAREVRLTEAEFEFAIDFLNRIGSDIFDFGQSRCLLRPQLRLGRGNFGGNGGIR